MNNKHGIISYKKKAYALCKYNPSVRINKNDRFVVHY